MNPLNIQIPEKCYNVLSKNARYKVLYGGRGGARSWSVARYLIARGSREKLRVLCAREVQNTIRDSVYRLLCDQIVLLGLEDYFRIVKEGIRGRYGSEFLFKGLRHNSTEIKSTEGIDICWVEEAERVSGDSWNYLTPTIRKDNSEILITFNPETEGSPTCQRFLVNPPPEAAVAEVNYEDNPWFPEVLRREMEYDKRTDYDKYLHVWRGKYKKYAASLIFKNKLRVEDFETPEGVRLYFGADFGFSNDPSVLVRMFVRDRRLYIDYEAYAIGVELEELQRFYGMVPESDRWPIVADSERPDTISYLSNKGFNIRGAEKGKGSVADGIEFLRSFEEIVIHTRCRGAIDNFSNYKWKQDRITEEVLPMPAKGSDHVPDSCRYALESLIKSKTSLFDVDFDSVSL